MAKLRRRVFPVLLALCALGAIAVAVSYVLAFASLADGPNIGGYGYLEAANGSVRYLAVLVVLTVAARVDITRMRFAVGGLALASGIVAGAAGGLSILGSTLSNFQPLEQPAELNSLLLAIWGSGMEILPAAVILAIGAALIASVSVVVRWLRLDYYERAASARA